MNSGTLAILLQEGGKFLSQMLMVFPPKRSPTQTPEPDISQEILPEPAAAEAPAEESKDTGIEAGCVPCAIGHFSTCSGLLDEGMRFVQSDGLGSKEVIIRISHCLKELNAMEREDLSPQKIHNLPSFEKELAIKALKGSRATRHDLEALSSVDDLEAAAANVGEIYQDISQRWFQNHLAGARR